MIIKSFVALGFVTKIDDMFSENFPQEIKETSENLTLVIGKDQNTYSKLWKRFKKARANGQGLYLQTIFNIFINLWFLLVNNFYIIFYYYFFPLICILL
jgi:hypothetical protein